MNDDTGHLQRLLDDMAEGRSIELDRGQVYTVSRTLTLSPVAMKDAWLFGRGAVIHSVIGDKSPVFRIAAIPSQDWVSRLNFLDFTIIGHGSEGNGIELYAPTKDAALSQLGFERVAVEGVGGDGWNIIGNIFESEWHSCAAEACGGNGVTFGSTPDKVGLLSAIRWRGGARSIRNNAKIGMEIVNDAYDVHVEDTYFLLNGGLAFAAHNGVREMSNCGFENNQQFAAVDGPALWGQSFGTFQNVSATPPANGSKQARLMDFFIAPDAFLTLNGCAGGGIITGNAAGFMSTRQLQGAWTLNSVPV